jgi:hypothetical protein
VETVTPTPPSENNEKGKEQKPSLSPHRVKSNFKQIKYQASLIQSDVEKSNKDLDIFRRFNERLSRNALSNAQTLSFSRHMNSNGKNYRLK